MCYSVSCRRRGKTTRSGRGAYVDQVRVIVPKTQ